MDYDEAMYIFVDVIEFMDGLDDMFYFLISELEISDGFVLEEVIEVVAHFEGLLDG